MTALMLVCGSLVIVGGLVLVALVVAANVRKRSYDVDAAMAAHRERMAAKEPLTILEAEPKEAVS